MATIREALQEVYDASETKVAKICSVPEDEGFACRELAGDGFMHCMRGAVAKLDSKVSLCELGILLFRQKNLLLS